MAGRVSLPARLHETSGRFTPGRRRDRSDRLRQGSPDRPAPLDRCRLLQELAGVRTGDVDQVGGRGPGPDPRRSAPSPAV